MMGINMNGVFEFMVAGAVAMVILIGFAMYSVYDYIYVPEEIISTTEIKPELRIIQDGVKSDTLFVYREN
jgi:hypothetical protein